PCLARRPRRDQRSQRHPNRPGEPGAFSRRSMVRRRMKDEDGPGPSTINYQLSTRNNRRFGTAFLTYAVLVLCAAVFVAPFVWMVSTSLKIDSQIFTAE